MHLPIAALAQACGYAVLLWYVSTGLILLLNHLPHRTFRVSFAAASLIGLLALAGLAIAARHPTVTAAYLGFTCGVLVWGWHEMSFFMGFITGPRRAAGPPATGWRHFWHAAQTCLYHEAAIALTAALLAAISLGHAAPVGCVTFLSLWVMRLSAKLNIFLGVRNLNEDWIPRRLAYLLPYMRHRRMNWLLPVSLLGGTAASLWFAAQAIAPHATPAQLAGATLIAAILALAVIEHAFMVLPLPFARLWEWAGQWHKSKAKGLRHPSFPRGDPRWGENPRPHPWSPVRRPAARTP